MNNTSCECGYNCPPCHECKMPECECECFDNVNDDEEGGVIEEPADFDGDDMDMSMDVDDDQ